MINQKLWIFKKKTVKKLIKSHKYKDCIEFFFLPNAHQKCLIDSTKLNIIVPFIARSDAIDALIQQELTHLAGSEPFTILFRFALMIFDPLKSQS